MGQAAQQFRDALHESWRADDPEKETAAVRSVLIHLRRRLPGPEVEHLEAELPPDIRQLWAEPRLERPGRKAPIEETDYGQFMAAVQTEAGLPSTADAEIVTRAVFRALGRFISAEEQSHVANQLPKGLKDIWAEEA